MTKCAPAWRLLLLLCLAFFFAGCSQFKRSGVAEDKDPHYLEAKRREVGSDWRGAVESYERALQSNPNNSAAHFDLAILWDKHLNDPAAAIYHFQKHLSLNTNSSQVGFIKDEINNLKRELGRTHSYVDLDRGQQKYVEQLLATNKMYESRIAALEAELNRGPRYITNEVIKYVKLPEIKEGSGSLTKPTTIVEAPDLPRNNEPEEKPKVQAPARAEQPNKVASAPSGNSSRDRSNGSRPPRVNRETPKPPVQSAATRTRSHRVKPGETMDVVAKQYNISIAELRAANPGMGKGTRAGQVLNIPQK